MKRLIIACAVLLAMSTAFFSSAFAAEESPVCYPSAIIVSEDGTELKKIYDLSPEDDPAGIPRSDFEQGGFHYCFTDILRQELPEREERTHTETITLDSPKKDMESVLALLPQEREVVTEDGFVGTLSLKLDTVRVEVAGYRLYSQDHRGQRKDADSSGHQLADQQYRQCGRLRHRREIHRHCHLYRHQYRQLCQRIYCNGRLFRQCGSYQSEPRPLYCHL